MDESLRSVRDAPPLDPDSTDDDEKTIELRRPNSFGIAFAPDGSRMAVANGDCVSAFAIESE